MGLGCGLLLLGAGWQRGRRRGAGAAKAAAGGGLGQPLNPATGYDPGGSEAAAASPGGPGAPGAAARAEEAASLKQRSDNLAIQIANAKAVDAARDATAAAARHSSTH
jgi:hypothetical protein